MGTTHRFIAEPSSIDDSNVIQWFLNRDGAPKIVRSERGVLLHFQKLGALTKNSAGSIEPKRSPLVTVFAPRIERGILWTVGEVHFLATPLRKRFPRLDKVSAAFATWLASHERVFPPTEPADYSYFLEGSIRNFDSPVFALESGLRALQKGQYFVGDGDGSGTLERVCKALRLRGCFCAD